MLSNLKLDTNSVPQLVRVRRLITQFCYSELVYTGIIPDLSLFTREIQTKKYPPWVYKMNKTNPNIFMDFGLFAENVIVNTIKNQPIDYSQIWTQVSQIPTPSELQTSNNFMGGIINWIQSIFTGQSIEHNTAFQYKNVEGHPDLIAKFQNEMWILDIKTSSGFKNMAHQSYLQILAYCVLARANGYICNYIGILLPLQREILWYNLTNWDESFYRNLLIRESNWVQKDIQIPNFGNLEDLSNCTLNIFGLPSKYIDSDILGSHISKQSTLTPEFTQIQVPIQIFLSNPQGKGFVSQSDLLLIQQNMTPSTTLFIHAPYIINLCSDDSAALDRLKHELLAGQQLNAKGVVIHVGKAKSYDIPTALHKMEQSILQVLPSASATCPLLIETPAGEGTELCSGCSQLQSFYQRFNNTPNLRICVDIAHIWGASYDPEYYINSWIKKFPGAISLVHFNDSEVCRGSRVDKHYPAGLGQIGYDRMWAVHEICRKHNIPMVRE